MVYEWKTRWRKVDANEAGKVFEKLEQTVGLTAANVVEASRAKDAPLHNEFEWDDSVAGERWREQQARVMIADLVIKVEEVPNAPTVRAFVKVEPVEPNYENIRTVVMSEDKTQALIEIAKGELESFKRKYRDIEEFSALFKEIDKIIEAA